MQPASMVSGLRYRGIIHTCLRMNLKLNDKILQYLQPCLNLSHVTRSQLRDKQGRLA